MNFRDVTSLFQDPDAFQAIVEAFAVDCTERRIGVVAAVDARGFIVGGALACRMRLPFVLVRKKGKLPFKTLAEDYALEYGKGTVEVHADACKPGARVLIVDDLIATGGTLLRRRPSCSRTLGGDVVGVAAVIDLPDLGGSRKLREAGLSVRTPCEFGEVA